MTATKRKQTERWLYGLGYGKKEIDRTVQVYNAEQYGMPPEPVFRTRAEVKEFVALVQKYPFWNRMWKRFKIKKFKLTFLPKGRTVAWGGPRGIDLPDNPHGRSLHTILHEMAHAATGGGHRQLFCLVLVNLTHEFAGRTIADRLRQRYYQTGALQRPRRKR